MNYIYLKTKEELELGSLKFWDRKKVFEKRFSNFGC